MTHWVSILLPVATLIIGSVLTMAGQALSDRRQEGREEKAQRNQFRADNFDMHRTAMLAMQETLRTLGDEVTAEEARRKCSGEYEYFDTHHMEPSNFHKLILDDAQWLEQMNERLVTGALSEAERRDLNAEIESRIARFSEEGPRVLDVLEGSSNLLKSRSSFYEIFIKSSGDMRLCMQRSGSNNVVDYGEELLDAVSNWALNLISADGEDLLRKVRDSRNRVDRALSNALRNGPYDKFQFEDNE